MLHPIERYFLNSLHCFMKADAKMEPVDFTMEQWKDLYRIADMHHVVPMVHEAICKAESFQTADTQVRSVFKKRSLSILIMQTQKTSSFFKCYQEMINAGIKPLIVKGLICRLLYKNPDLRKSSDEDLLISKADFAKCDKFLLEYGFSRDDIDLANPPYEVSYFNRATGNLLEIHTALMPEDDGKFQKMNSFFANAFENAVAVNAEGTTVYTLKEEQHLLYLLCHAFKHFVSSGFGVRQLCDILQMAEKDGAKIDWTSFLKQVRALEMYTFFMNLLDIGEKYLGFDWEKSGCPRPSRMKMDNEDLIKDILDGGVYGSSSVGRLHSANITLTAFKNGQEEEQGVSLKTSLFPPYEYMKARYPYVKKAAVLLPVAWVHRMVNYAVQTVSLKINGEKDVNSIAIGKERLKLLRKYGKGKS